MDTTPHTAGEANLEVHLSSAELGAQVVAEVTQGLQAPQASLPLGHLSDRRTRELWTELEASDDYYQARCERTLVGARAAAAVEIAQTDSIVMLGATATGAIDALVETAHRLDALAHFVAVGRLEAEVEAACTRVSAHFPALDVRGVVADPIVQLDLVTFPHPSLVVVSGPTIGHLGRRERARFLARLAARLNPGDSVLISADLAKDHRRLVAAYDDPQGHHAARTRNALVVLSRELDATVDPDGWVHVAHWDERNQAVDIALRASGGQEIVIESLDLARTFHDGELVALEHNSVFVRNGFDAQLALAGLAVNHWWTDPDGDYALTLASV